jgi:ribose transport system permease protein
MVKMATFDRFLSKSSIDTRTNMRTLAILVGLVVLASVFSKGIFLQPNNLVNLVYQNAVLIIIAIGQLLVIATGGIDLSVGAVMAVSSVLVVLFQDWGLAGSFVVAILVAAIFGLVSGALVTYVRLPAFVVTLATMQIGYSVSKILSDWGGSRGGTVYNSLGGLGIPTDFVDFYKANVAGIPYPLFICLGFLVLIGFYLKSSNGHFIYPVGGNQKAAFLSGIPVVRVKIAAYVISAALAAVGGILFVARVGLGDPQAGTWIGLDSIAAVSIGGASLSGGMGTVTGTFIGVIILSVLNNIMNLLGVPPTMQPAIKGLVILIAVYLNSAQKKN